MKKREGLDNNAPGHDEEMDGRIHVRVRVAAHGQDAGLKDRPGLVARAELTRDLPAKVRPDGKAQIDDGHGG